MKRNEQFRKEAKLDKTKAKEIRIVKETEKLKKEKLREDEKLKGEEKPGKERLRKTGRMKKVWMAGIFAAVLLNGCSVRDYQAKRAETWLEKFLPGGSDKEEQKQEDLDQEPTDAFAQGAKEEGESDPEKESSPESTGGQENEVKNQPIVLGSPETAAENSRDEEISYKTKYVVNCKKSITLREHPSTSAAQLDEISFGEPVSFIKDDVDGFSKIVYQGKTGYVLAAYLGDTAPTVNDTAYYTMRVVNCHESISLRKSPSIKAVEICQIPLGAIVSYVDSAADGFYEISYLGKNGYALASYLEFYSAPEQENSSAGAENSSASTDTSQAVRVSFDYFIQNERECADIVGLNAQNQKVWQYEARSSHGMTELESVQAIGVVGDAYYFNEDGTIVALSLSSGRVLWKNADFGGASISFDTDEQGTLYLCGYYGPDLCAIDRNGNTLIHVQSFSPELQWPYEVRYEDHAVYVTCTAGGMDDREVVVKYDLATGGISY